MNLNVSVNSGALLTAAHYTGRVDET